MPRLAKYLLWAVACLVCASAACGNVHAQPQQAASDHVVLITIDGLKPEYYTRPQEFNLRLPNLQGLRKAGSWAEAVIGQYPSVTRPSHTSIVTGVRPAKHGIVENSMFDPIGGFPGYTKSSDIRVPSLWTVARASGLKTAAIFWPVTSGAAIDYLIEDLPVPAAVNPLQFYRDHSTPGLVDGIVEKSGAESAADEDAFAVAAARYIITTHRPNLVLLHLAQTDAAQHRFGVGSEEALRAYELTDENIGKVVEAVRQAGIQERTTIIVAGDHGFASVHSVLQPNVILRRAGLLQTDSAGQIRQWQAVAYGPAICLRDRSDSDLARKVEALFREMADGPYRGIFRIVDRSELDRAGSHPEALFVLEPVEGYYVGTTNRITVDQFVIAATLRGMHGYLPNTPSMFTGLLISGSGIRTGIKIPIARQIDIAPTVARLLGLELKEADGVPMVGILK
jgi:predicted AlkP superfamily pyrophosphatase or phosphodiesterase